MTTMQLHVEAPAVAPYQYGLASVAVPAPTDDVHWQLGVEYEPISSYGVGVLPGACDAGVPAVDLPDHLDTVKALPFALYAGVDCKSVGYTEAYVMDRAEAILEGGWQHGAETALWTGGGVADLAPVLNGDGVATVVGTGQSIVTAVASLEAYLAENYLGRGVIHAPRAVAAYAARDRQTFEREDGKLETSLGTQWCFGGGYDGSGPSNATPPADTLWIYVTGLVTVRRATPFVNGGLAQALNRATNSTLYFAEQPTVLTVDGPIAAVSVDLTK